MRLTDFHRVVFCVFAAALLAPNTIVARPQSRPKFIEQKPIFDTSVLPDRSHFQINVKHTDFLYPQNSTLLLHGNARIVNLRADQSQNLLQGRVEEQHAPIQTAQYGLKAVFQNDLFALVPKIAPELTRQLEGQIEKAQKKLSSSLEQEQTQMQKAFAEQPAANIPVLPGRAAVPLIPAAPASVASIPSPELSFPVEKPFVPLLAMSSPNPVATSAMESERTRLKQSAAPDMAKAVAKSKNDLIHARTILGSFGGGGGGGGGKPPSMGGGGQPGQPPETPIDLDKQRMPSTRTSSVLSIPAVHVPLPALPVANVPKPANDLSAQLKSPAAEIEAQLASAGRFSTGVPDVNGRLMDRSQARDLDVSGRLAKPGNIELRATPQLGDLTTHIRRLPIPDLPALSARASRLPDARGIDTTIVWDKWHANFARLSHGPLLAAFKSAGGPAGSNTVSITVLPNHRVSVILSKSSNKTFDDAVLRAYKSLDKNPGLAYPSGSMRSSVTFLIDNEHKLEGVAAGVNSRTSADREIRKYKRP